MTHGKNGRAIRGGDLINMCVEANVPQCAGFVAADAQRVIDGKGVVVISMGTAECQPAGYLIVSCIHDVEAIIRGIRKAAEDAFKDQPCTECES